MPPHRFGLGKRKVFMTNYKPQKKHYGVVYLSAPDELTTVASFDGRPKDTNKWVPLGKKFLGVVESYDPSQLRSLAVYLHDTARKSRLLTLDQAKEEVRQAKKLHRRLTKSRTVKRDGMATMKRSSGRISRPVSR